MGGANFLGLLGIHFAQFPERWQIGEGKKIPATTPSGVPLIQEGGYIKGLSGMTCVLPAWSIQKVLDMPKLKHGRDAANARLTEEAEKQGKVAPEPEVTSEEEIDRLRDDGLRRALNTPPEPRTSKSK